MFLSKIWVFLITLAGAIALTIALTLPRPAQRTLVNEEQNRLSVACGVIGILLADDARNRVELAGSFSRAPEVVAALEAASNASSIDEGRSKQVREIGGKLMKGIQGRQPDFAMLIDRRGRVVARVKVEEGDFGDVFAGRPLVDDALAGYLRDDLWATNGTMYFVSASPVVKRDPPVAYVGAVVIGHKITNELAQKLVSSLNVDIGFFMDNADVASSNTIALDHAPMLEALKTLKGGDLGHDCQANHPLDLHAGNADYTAVVARLPGEAQQRQAFYSVLIKRPEARGFMGTLKVVSQGDLSFANFPWILVGGVFLVALGLGIALMFAEADRPLKRLANDAVKLAKGEKERLSEDVHGGKFGSIARSVNIHIDKLGREAKSARTNLDSLLGPAPEGSLGTIDLLAGTLPPVRPGGPGPSSSPAPSDFKFHDAPLAPPVAVRTPPTRAPTPPPIRMPTAPSPVVPAAVAPPPPAPPRAAFPPPLSLDDDILDGAQTMQVDALAAKDNYFQQVFDQFIAVKKSCNEPITGLTLQKFSEKLVKNRDDLIAKTGCREVRFTVYVKDGKAALKATPVKDD